MNREYHKWFSPRLGREMELLVFGHAGEVVLVFPTREGRFYDYEDWGLVESNRECLEAGRQQLICVDSVDAESLYCFTRPPPERIARHKVYEEYILEEVIPLAQQRSGGTTLAAHGCSFGAYHSVNLALRHPAYFHRVVALSGRYDLTRPLGEFVDLFSGYYCDDIYFHTPTHFLPHLNDAGLLSRLRRVHFRLVVGAGDPFYENTQELARQLADKAVPCDLTVWEGEAHRACHWRQMAQSYLRIP